MMGEMSPKSSTLLAAAALLSLCVACATEEPAMDEAAQGPPPMQEGIEPLEQREEAAPGVGDLFPDVTVVSDTGEPVNIRKLAGEKPYTVLTLGCLT